MSNKTRTLLSEQAPLVELDRTMSRDWYNFLSDLFSRLLTRTPVSGEALSDQSGADAVLTFTFSDFVDSVLVLSQGGDSRADPFGGAPTAARGRPCLDGVPTQVEIRTLVVRVYAPTGSTISVWGLRY